MRLIIAGGRDRELSRRDIGRLARLAEELQVTLVVTGGAAGVDHSAFRWAQSVGLDTAEFRANWDMHGRAAGPIRNRAMAQNADAVVLFPGGRGTQSMFDEAVKAGLRVFDWRGGENESKGLDNG